MQEELENICQVTNRERAAEITIVSGSNGMANLWITYRNHDVLHSQMDDVLWIRIMNDSASEINE